MRSDIPEEVMRLAASIGHSDYLLSLPFETRALLSEDIAERLMEERVKLYRMREENERLRANIDRLTSNPADHRYWEGRYRDEAKENDKLREAIIDACDLLMERTKGNGARSPAHNARVILEAAIGHFNGRPV